MHVQHANVSHDNFIETADPAGPENVLLGYLPIDLEPHQVRIKRTELTSVTLSFSVR